MKELLSRLGRPFFASPRLRVVRPEHFRVLEDPRRQRDFFARVVRMVVVEVHSYCNRRCWFCPNSFIDRHSTRRYLDPGIYARLLEDLRGTRWRGRIVFSGYSEPFADEVFYERVAEARRALPRTLLHTNSNGDFLDDDALRRAEEAGLSRLFIQVYIGEDEPYGRPAVERAAKAIRERMPSVKFVPAAMGPGRFAWRGRRGKMSLMMYARDFRADGVNRCGLPLRDAYRRSSPCLMSFQDVNVDFTGSVVACCNLRSDFPAHLSGVWGRLDETPGSVFRVFSGPAAVAWRRKIIGFDPKSPPCEDCRFDLLADTRPNRRAVERIARRKAGGGP